MILEFPLAKKAFFLFLLCSVFSLYAQESILESYERNFVRASLSSKSSVLLDASRDQRFNEFGASLYEFALQYALSYGELLRDDPDMIILVTTAARGAGELNSTVSINSLLSLLSLFSDSHSRVEIIRALSNTGRGNRELLAYLNNFLDTQNRDFSRGSLIDYPVLISTVNALGVFGDPSSFSLLFNTLVSPYPQSVIQETLRALSGIEGNHKDFLIGVILNNPFPEKAAAFRIGAYNENLAIQDRGEIAISALGATLNSNDSIANLLRYDAVTVLTRLRWSPASTLVIRNFYRVQSDFAEGLASRERLLEAISSLGVMSTSEAAEALALQLGYINSQTESSGTYDEAIVLSLINALGELGDKAAFDYLLYISYLNYPDRIQSSAREALNRLQW